MYTKELFDKSVSILVAAYMNDMLKHAYCGACAVGNLIAGNLGVTACQDFNVGGGFPGYINTDNRIVAVPWLNYGRYFIDTNPDVQVLNVNQLIGYTDDDISKIENAFERKDCDMFLSMMQVVDVLCEIHGMNEEEKKESKALFVKV